MFFFLFPKSLEQNLYPIVLSKFLSSELVNDYTNDISILAALPFLLHVLPPISLLTFLHFTIIIIYILSCKHSKGFHLLSISDSRLLFFPFLFFCGGDFPYVIANSFFWGTKVNNWASLVAQLVKNPPAMQETWVQPLSWEDPLKKGKATHSNILVWRISWTVQFMGT